MQYLLTQTEYDSLLAGNEQRLKLADKKLQTLCTKIADEMPVKWEGWQGKPIIEPWGCILTKGHEWYCDNCPVREICPNQHKTYSQ